MARTIRDAKLETRAARDRLRPGRKPHYKTLEAGRLHLAYRRKRKDLPGKWLVRHYLGDERYHVAELGVADDFQDATDNSDVLTFADAQRAAFAHRLERRRSGKGTTVAEAIAEYISAMAEERPAAAADAERTASRLIIPQLGRKRLADLATEDITAWRNALAKEPARLRTRPGAPQNFKAAPTTKEAQRARKATVNRVWTTLRAALNRAFKSGHVQDDLAWRRVEPFKKVSARRPGHLSVAECKRLINAADPASGFRDLVQAALSTGCRFGELSALDVRDFQRGKLHIRTSKSGRPRDVVLSDEGIKFFERLAAGRPGNEPMLMRNGGRWQKSEQARPMREACKHAKITPAVGFHALRHSWASLAVMNAMPLMVVARNLGHADTRMVELHYGHLAESYIDKEIRDAAPVFGLKRDKKVAALPR